jgi:hypothetical protein
MPAGDDAEKIPAETRLMRRVNPLWVVWDSNSKQLRPTSQNYQDSNDGTPMSVYAENIAREQNETIPDDFLRGRSAAWHLVAVTAGDMRKNKQVVRLETANQDDDDRHPSHAVVEGPKDGKMRSKLGANYEWIKAPPNFKTPPSERP